MNDLTKPIAVMLIATLLSACERPPTPAPVPVKPVSQAVSMSPTWQNHENKDPITDVVSKFIALDSVDAPAFITVSCDHKIVGISLLAKDLWSKYENAYISHRFDQKPGVEAHPWLGREKSVELPFDEAAAFLRQMLVSKKLLVRYETLDGFTSANFENIDIGLPVALAHLSTECLRANGMNTIGATTTAAASK